LSFSFRINGAGWVFFLVGVVGGSALELELELSSFFFFFSFSMMMILVIIMRRMPPLHEIYTVRSGFFDFLGKRFLFELLAFSSFLFLLFWHLFFLVLLSFFFFL